MGGLLSIEAGQRLIREREKAGKGTNMETRSFGSGWITRITDPAADPSRHEFLAEVYCPRDICMSIDACGRVLLEQCPGSRE